MKTIERKVESAFWTLLKPGVESGFETGNFCVYGIKTTHGDKEKRGWSYSEEEAKSQAESLGARDDVPVVALESNGRLPGRRDFYEEREALYKEQYIQEIKDAGIAFRPIEEIRALPTIGGILEDGPLSRKTKYRFPKSVILQVSDRVAEKFKAEGPFPNWLVVEMGGCGVAVLPEEAKAFEAEEANNWIPDLGDGFPSVPSREDFERAGIV